MSQGDDMGEDNMRPEYDPRGGVRGKYYKQYMEGTNVVLLDPSVAAVFRDPESVNQALRVLIKAAGQIGQGTSTKIDRTQRRRTADQLAFQPRSLFRAC